MGLPGHGRLPDRGEGRGFHDTARQQNGQTTPLKIALIAHLKYPIIQPFSGGLEMHTHLVARKLALLGHDVTMFAAHGSDQALNVVSICEPTAALSGPREWQVENQAYHEIVERIAGADFDVVHNNSLHPVPLAYASTLQPMLTVLHTPPFSPLVDQARHTRSRFVAVSQSVADQWREHIHVADIVANGIELDLFAPVTDSARPPRAIWYGRIVPEKGLHLAIEAARLASLEIDAAGPIIDREYWAQMILPRCGSDVHYLGHLDHVTLREHISRAGVVLVTPRWEEPFGLVAAEALACGTPVAAFRRGALPDVVGDAGVLADRDDPVDLARAARCALGIDALRCRRRAENALDCTTMIARYDAIYRTLAATRTRISAAAG